MDPEPLDIRPQLERLTDAVTARMNETRQAVTESEERLRTAIAKQGQEYRRIGEAHDQRLRGVEQALERQGAQENGRAEIAKAIASAAADHKVIGSLERRMDLTEQTLAAVTSLVSKIEGRQWRSALTGGIAASVVVGAAGLIAALAGLFP